MSTTPTSTSAALLATIRDVVAQHELAEGLGSEVIDQIARDALELNKLDDADWLHMQLATIAKDQASATPDKPDILSMITVSSPKTITSQEDLKAVLSEHQDWMHNVLFSSNPFPTGRANLRNQDLSGFDLEGVNLSCADLRGTILKKANLSGANLSRARLAGADLRGADLTKCDLRRADLKHADLRHTLLDDAQVLDEDLEQAFRRESDLAARYASPDQ